MSNIALVQTVTSKYQYFVTINVLFYQLFSQCVIFSTMKKYISNIAIFFLPTMMYKLENIWDNRNKWGAKTLSLQRYLQFYIYSFSLLTADHLFDLDIWWYFKEVYTSPFYFVLTFSGISKILKSWHINNEIFIIGMHQSIEELS